MNVLRCHGGGWGNITAILSHTTFLLFSRRKCINYLVKYTKTTGNKNEKEEGATFDFFKNNVYY